MAKRLKRTAGLRRPRERFLEVGADRTIELRWELEASWDGRFRVDPEEVAGARVKPVILVPEELVEHVARHELRQTILDAGAVYCKVPTVQVIRRKVTRDARHHVDLPLEDSLRLFAEEVTAEDAEEKVKFAATLAREADAGVKE